MNTLVNAFMVVSSGTYVERMLIIYAHKASEHVLSMYSLGRKW